MRTLAKFDYSHANLGSIFFNFTTYEQKWNLRVAELSSQTCESPWVRLFHFRTFAKFRKPALNFEFFLWSKKNGNFFFFANLRSSAKAVRNEIVWFFFCKFLKQCEDLAVMSEQVTKCCGLYHYVGEILCIAPSDTVQILFPNQPKYNNSYCTKKPF